MPRKNIRFGDLVRASGRPEIKSLWTAPNRDRSFTKAIKENRVLTITQVPTSKRKDFGRIGFQKARHASFLIFPRPLPQVDDARVVGINYALVEEG